ncbi:MAG: DNA damage-inducible protein D [Rikenellaceae bacterium]|jgi:DNA-damage-inducible protein D|nr:DNA damage-inducible protein D [Rikenellaceae bacterium]
MKASEITALFNQFEAAASEFQGVECWSARELQHLLGYSKWENFNKVVEKAKESAENAGEKISDHFPDVRKVIDAGKGAQHEIDDILLTRYACYLIAQNGDSRKEQISFAQNYFAVQTRRAELISQRLLERERVKARAKLMETERKLSGVLYERGVDNSGFALIRSKGDQALFRLSTSQLKRKLGMPEARPIADFLPTIGIKAKDLAAEMTSTNVQTKDLRGLNPIEREHVDNNLAVRQMLMGRGIQTELMPPAEDVKKVERRLESEKKKMLKNKK